MYSVGPMYKHSLCFSHSSWGRTVGREEAEQLHRLAPLVTHQTSGNGPTIPSHAQLFLV